MSQKIIKLQTSFYIVKKLLQQNAFTEKKFELYFWEIPLLTGRIFWIHNKIKRRKMLVNLLEHELFDH